MVAVPGATYAWTVDGGQISGDAAGDHITIVLGTNTKATVSVALTSGDCVSHGSGVIALHDPFSVRLVPIAAGNAGEPLTIIWSYDNDTPAQQTISGEFGAVTLPPDARNYTYTPANSGTKQFVIDAAMKQPGISPPPATRQRAVGRNLIGASSCTVAHAAANYATGQCVIPSVAIDAPTSAISDAKFDVSVRHQAGAVTTWTITNGFPATATGDVVTITAGSTGQVGVTARLTRGACTDSADRAIAITPKPVCSNPKAAVSAGSFACGSATLNASFTGTPPFKGTWSDDVPFETTSTSLARIVSVPGNYTITRFQDSVCEGTSSGVAVVPALYPSATITGKATSCTGADSATVFFTGKPPYSGCWVDGTCFQTNQAVLTKPITKAGFNTLASGADGTGCSFAIVGGVQAFTSPHVGLSKRCEWTPDLGNYANFFLFYDGTTNGPGITWSDGVKTGNARFSIRPAQTTTYTVASISEGICPALWDTPKSITIYPTPTPELAGDMSDLCQGTIVTMGLAVPPPPGTQVKWEVYGGTLFAGQGTNSIYYAANSSAGVGIVSTFNFSDPARCPLTTEVRRNTLPADLYATIAVDRSVSLRAGKTITIDFRLDHTVTKWSLTNSMNDPITPSGTCIPNGDQCYATYTSTHGAGQSTITLHATNPCQTKDVSVDVTILP